MALDGLVSRLLAVVVAFGPVGFAGVLVGVAPSHFVTVHEGVDQTGHVVVLLGNGLTSVLANVSEIMNKITVCPFFRFNSDCHAAVKGRERETIESREISFLALTFPELNRCTAQLSLD